MADNYYHNEGEKDAKRGKYNPPHGVGDDLHTWSKEGMERNRKENEAYDKGYSHARGQRDANEGRYDPPSGEKSSSSYDSGYSSSDSSSGGCFITTATLLSVGKTDNCIELNTFRDFRDNWLARQPDGKHLIKEYYEEAPKIVGIINSCKNRDEIYKELWDKSIEPCLNLIKQKDFISAKILYSETVLDLKNKFNQTNL